ncbi:MAG TPA: ABC transporter substrate-binding protein [Ruania sp.]|nr:ABC transporter substrate-binding protein [Ruania sp.]
MHSTSDRHPALSRRGFLTALSAAGGGAVLAGCSGGGSGGNAATGGGGESYDGAAVELAFWNGFTGGDGPVMQDLVDEFNAEHENITVKTTVIEWDDFYSRLPAALSSGDGPQVAIHHLDSLATSAARGLLRPLDDVADALELTEEDFLAPVWHAGVYDGSRFGIPLDVHPTGFFYNKTVMADAGLDPDNPPMDRESYEAALDVLLEKDIAGHWMSPHLFTGGHTLQSLIWQFGGDLFDADGTTATWAEDPGVEALTWMVDAIHKGWSVQDVGQDADMIALQNGQTAFNWNGIWSINTLNEVEDLDWGVARLPNIGGQDAAWAGSHNFVMTEQRGTTDDQLEASRVFINWISQQSVAWAAGGQVPARNSVRESEEFADMEHQAAIAEQAEDLRFPPSLPGIGDAMAELATALNEAVLLTKEPGPALTDAAERANTILEENRERYDY